MPLILPGNVGSATAATGFNVDNSLRFNGGSSDYLNRTNATPTNQLIWTFSFWVKLSDITDAQGSGNQMLLSDFGSASNRGTIFFESDDTLTISDRVSNSFTFKYVTTRLFRDVSAWYHIVINHNRTLSTPVTKVYVNGVQETSFSTSTNPSQNGTSYFNVDGQASYVGKYGGGNEYYNGYLAEAVWIDGQALDADQFGEFDEDSGIWKPIDVSGLTFGTNGFYLDFEDSSALGNDANGSNNWTSNNFAAINQTTDTCTNNFATMNPLDNYFAGSTFSEGNCKIVTTGGNITYNTSTMGFSSGKWYMEVKLGSSSGEVLGVIRGVSTGNNNDNKIGNRSDGFGYDYRGLVEGNGADLGGTFAAFDSGDVIGVYADLDNNELYFSKNGTLQNSGTGLTLPAGTYFFAVGDNHGSNAATLEVNFGNPISALDNTAITDDNGHGAFEYSPNITGDSVAKKFYALNTKNLAEFG